MYTGITKRDVIHYKTTKNLQTFPKMRKPYALGRGKRSFPAQESQRGRHDYRHRYHHHRGEVTRPASATQSRSPTAGELLLGVLGREVSHWRRVQPAEAPAGYSVGDISYEGILGAQSTSFMPYLRAQAAPKQRHWGYECKTHDMLHKLRVLREKNSRELNNNLKSEIRLNFI